MGQVRYSPDGRFLLAASSIGIYFYETQNYSLVKFIDTDTEILDIAITPDGERVAASSFDTVFLFNIDDGKLIMTFDSSSGNDFLPLHKIAFSPDGQILATGSNWYDIKLWNVRDGNLIRSFEEPGCYINAIAFSPDGRFLATTGSAHACSTSIWNLNGTMLDERGPHVSGGATDSLAFSPDGRFLAEGSDACRLWTISENGELLRSGKLYTEQYPSMIDSIAFSPDGKMLAAGGIGGLYFWQMSTEALIRKIDAYNSRFGGIAWSPDSKTLATGTRENGIEIWNVTDGKLLRTLDTDIKLLMP